jgi:hypothetical protein
VDGNSGSSEREVRAVAFAPSRSNAVISLLKSTPVGLSSPLLHALVKTRELAQQPAARIHLVDKQRNLWDFWLAIGDLQQVGKSLCGFKILKCVCCYRRRKDKKCIESLITQHGDKNQSGKGILNFDGYVVRVRVRKK